MIRYLVPNAITAASIAFGVLAIQAALLGRPREGAFFIIYCVLTDKLDGIAARRLRASSEFGTQLDSLADLVAFGVAPAALLFAFFSARPELGWTGRPLLLRALGVGYVVCAAERLARFNVHAGEPAPVYFGTPSTFAGGTVAALFATLLKYGDPSWSEWPASDPRLLGGVRLDAAMQHVPWFLAVAGLAMVSTLRVPKLGRPRRPLHYAMLAVVAVCYVAGFARLAPELLAATAVGFFAITAAWNLLSPGARALRPPRLFSRPRDGV